MFIGSYETFEDQQQPQFRLSCIDNLLYIPHLHRQYELIYVQEGEMTAHIDGAAQFLTAGECSLATSHKLHSYANDQPGKFYMAIFEPELVPLFSSTLRKNDLASPFVQPRDPAQRSEFIHLIGRIFEAGTTDPVAISGYMTALLAQISAHTGLVPQHRNPRPTLLQQVLEYVAQHYNEGSITLESTARALGLSHDYAFSTSRPDIAFPSMSCISALTAPGACWSVPSAALATSPWNAALSAPAPSTGPFSASSACRPANFVNRAGRRIGACRPCAVAANPGDSKNFLSTRIEECDCLVVFCP